MKLSIGVARVFGLGSAVLALLAAVGCGYGGNTTVVRTTGNFSAATLNGTYVYQIHGNSQFGIYHEVGAFTADGNGNITAGSDDSSLNAGGQPVSFTGSYQILNDGTGSITFTNSAFGAITFALTVVSSSKVDLMEADFFADATGTAELQAAGTPGTPSGTFVFRMHEPVSALAGGAAASEIGVVTISGGNVTSGTGMDQNLLPGAASQLTLTGGSFLASANFGRGTATLTDSTNLTRSLVYYMVNSGKFFLLLANANSVGSGSAEAQSGNVAAGLSGSYAFGSSGDDVNNFAGTATVGVLSASGGTISDYTFDAMQDGSYSNGSTTGTYTTSANGRVAVTLSSGSPEVFWMVSPGRAFFMIESGGAVEDGTADLQTANSFSASTLNGQFAVVMGGIESDPFNNVVDFSRIGAMNFDGSSRLTLAELVNSAGTGAQPPSGGGLTGNYQIGPKGRVTASVKNSNNAPLDLVMYAVSGSDAYVLQVDSGTVTSGTVGLQH